MENEKIKIIYEDKDLLVVNKPAGMVVFPELLEAGKEKTLIDYLLEQCPELKKVGKPPRYGIIHRLDKDTSGILLVAKSNQALDFFQKQFSAHAESSGRQGKMVVKKYLALVVGNVKTDEDKIETLIGRSRKNRKKQKVYLINEPEAKRKGLRKAITDYKVIKRFENYTLIEAQPETGRKHQIRCHLAYLGHPVVGDKLYGFKNQPIPEGVKRHFLHSYQLTIKLPNGEVKEFKSELPKDLEIILRSLKITND